MNDDPYQVPTSDLEVADEIKIFRYIVKFSVVYVIGLIAVTAIFTVLDLNGNSGIAIVVLIAAAMYTVGKFIEENKRVPSKEEKSKLVWLSLIACWLISIILAILFVSVLDGLDAIFELFSLVRELDVILLLGILLIASLLQFAILSSSYGWLAKRQLKGLQNRGKL